MADFFVIGMNALGRRLVRELHQRKHKVTIGDKCDKRVNRMSKEMADVVRVDTTERDALIPLRVERFDYVIVCMGHCFENAERTTLALRDLGARHITNVATTEVRARILKKIGAHAVVTPGLDLARNLATAFDDERILRFTYIDDERGIAEVVVQKPVTLPEEWRGFFGEDCVVTAVRRQDSVEVRRQTGVALEVGDQLLVFGTPAAILAGIDRVF